MKNYIFFSILILFTSCNINTVYNNRESDLQDAEEVANELFKNIESGNYENASAMFGSKFFEYSSEKELSNLFDSIKTLGVVKNRKLIEWKTVVVKGPKAKSEYFLGSIS